MKSFFEFIGFILSSQKFLLFTELTSFTFKLFLLIIIVHHSIRASMSKRFLLLLIGVLSGSMFHSDASRIPLDLRTIFFPNIDFRIIGFMGRIGWVFFLVQNQSLTLLLENLVEKKL